MSAAAISQRQTAPATLNRAAQAPPPRPAQTTTTAAPPSVSSDASSLSSAAQSAPSANPYEGVAAGVTSVKVEPWSPGNNSKSTLDGILKSQGYTSEEIYGKGDDGKSLLDRVSAANNLRDPNLIHPDQNLKIPTKEKPAEQQAPQSASLSSDDIAPGETGTTTVRNEGERLSSKTTVANGEDGSVAARVESRNHANPDTNMTTEMAAGPGGKIVSASEETADGVETVTMGRNADGSALTVQDQAVGKNGSDVSITDGDDNKNLYGMVHDDKLVVVNPGTTPGSGDVTSAVDLSEKSNDGFFENAGRGIAEFFGFGSSEPQQPQVFGDAEGVTVQRGKEGETSVLAAGNNGEVRQIYSSAGDTDDTWVERAGESVDNFFRSATPDIPRSEDPNYRLTRRGYRRINN